MHCPPSPASSSSSFGVELAGLPYTMSFEAARDDRGPVLKIMSSYADNLCVHPDSQKGYLSDFYDESPSSLSQWSPMISEADPFESSPQYAPSIYSPYTPSDNFEDSLTRHCSSWPFDEAAPSSSNPPFYAFPAEDAPRCFPNGLVYSRQDNACSSSRAPEFTNVFDFDFPGSSPHDLPPLLTSSRSSGRHLRSSISARSSRSSVSSSSSLDGFETKSESREPSPTTSDPDTQNQRRRFPCLILGCARRFTSQYTLKVHMEAHKPKPRTSFPCTLGCSERFSRQHDRLRHEVAKHGKICEFLCDDCGRFFSTKKTLGNHKCPVAQGGTRWVTN